MNFVASDLDFTMYVHNMTVKANVYVRIASPQNYRANGWSDVSVAVEASAASGQDC
jgi:hypothetical protein